MTLCKVTPEPLPSQPNFLPRVRRPAPVVPSLESFAGTSRYGAKQQARQTSVSSWSRSPISENYDLVTQVTAIMLSVMDKVSVPVACIAKTLHEEETQS